MILKGINCRINCGKESMFAMLVGKLPSLYADSQFLNYTDSVKMAQWYLKGNGG